MAAPKKTPDGPVAQEALHRFTLLRLVENNMNYSKTSREMGVSRQCLHNWWKELDEDEKQDLKAGAHESEADKWRTVLRASLTILTPRLERMRDHDLIVTAGIAADKLMRYEGVPEQQTITINQDDIAAEIQGILKGIKTQGTDKTPKVTQGKTLPA